MKKPIIIGITGGIGGGKSTISALLREKGFLVYDTDQEAKRLQNTNPDIRKKLINLFGDDIYNQENVLDRKKLAGIVFKQPDLLSKLNEIIHPEVKRDFLNWQEKHADEPFLFIESAILFEGGLKDFVDKIVVVTAPEDIRIQRVIKRDQTTATKVRERMAQQMPENEKIKLADIVLDSDGDNISNNFEMLLLNIYRFRKF